MGQPDGFGEAFRLTSTTDLRGLDLEWLSDTIGAIYDCVLQPRGWDAAIGAIAEHFRFASAAMGVLQLRHSAQDLKISYSMDEAWIAVGDAYTEDSIALWGGPARVQSFPLDEPVVASDIRPVSEWKNFRYFREILEPRGLIDAAAIALAREPQLVGYLALNRHSAAGPIRQEEVDGLRLIAPHLRRAVTISNLFDLRAVEAQSFAAVLNGMTCAVVLVDEKLQVVHANRAAETMFGAGDLLQLVQGRLRVRGKMAGDALQAAVRIAAEREAALAQRGIGIPARTKDKAPAVLHVLPLHHGELRPGLAQRSVAAVFVVTGDGAAATPVDAIATLYDFTPAESQIFASLSQGHSLLKTAESLGIAKSTARTHLLRVFAKTGCQRQPELVALAARLSLKL